MDLPPSIVSSIVGQSFLYTNAATSTLSNEEEMVAYTACFTLLSKIKQKEDILTTMQEAGRRKEETKNEHIAMIYSNFRRYLSTLFQEVYG